jgi:hypothetical protein
MIPTHVPIRLCKVVQTCPDAPIRCPSMLATTPPTPGCQGARCGSEHGEGFQAGSPAEPSLQVAGVPGYGCCPSSGPGIRRRQGGPDHRCSGADRPTSSVDGEYQVDIRGGPSEERGFSRAISPHPSSRDISAWAIGIFPSVCHHRGRPRRQANNKAVSRHRRISWYRRSRSAARCARRTLVGNRACSPTSRPIQFVIGKV